MYNDPGILDTPDTFASHNPAQLTPDFLSRPVVSGNGETRDHFFTTYTKCTYILY